MTYTPKQMSILRFILETQREREVSPSVREICEHLGGRNVKTVAEHLDRLEEKGAIERERGVVRSIRVVDPDLTEDAGLVKLVGRIAAGVPIEAIEMPETLDILPALGLTPGREMFALQVRAGQNLSKARHNFAPSVPLRDRVSGLAELAWMTNTTGGTGNWVRSSGIVQGQLLKPAGHEYAIEVVERKGGESLRSARMLQTLLAVFLASAGEALAREPIVEKSDPAIVTHRLKLGDITVGFSDKGGGYLNYLDMGDGKNIVSARYGRGWQGSLRDQFHSGRYNPTQAGFTDYAGAPVTLTLTDNKLTIPSFNLPLYGDPVFDFTQHEDLVPDYHGYKDKGRTDTDGLDESELSQDDELRSEFDFEGFYENATALGGGKIPILRFYSRYTYARPPRAILQFGKAAKKKDGRPVINERARIADVSKAMPGRTRATDVDLSKIIFTAYGIRLLTHSGYTTPMWYEDGKWRSLTLKDIRGRGKEKSFELAPSTSVKFKARGILRSQFLLLAKGSDPDKSPAIALYCPASTRTNAGQILGLDRKTGRTIYREDRRERSFIMFSHVIPTQVGIRSRFFISGMLAPDHGNPKAVEALQHDTFVLFGTPREILQATQTLHRKLPQDRSRAER